MRSRYLWVALLGLTSAALVAQPGGGAPDAAKFEQGLAKCRDLVARSRWADAKAGLAKLIEEHRPADYVRTKAAEIDDLMRACAFRLAHPAPEPKSVISGELLSWNPSTGQIKIRYTKERMGDWTNSSGFRSHPARFKGPHSLELKGDSYPRLGGSGSAPVAIVVAEEVRSIAVGFGMAQENVGASAQWVPARLIAASKDSKDTLDEKPTSPCRPDKPFTLKVRVGETDLQVSYGGRVFLTGKKPKDQWGQLGFENLRVDEVVVEGKIEAAWIQQRLDEKEHEAKTAFLASYRRSDHLPGWLFRPVAAPAAKAEPAADEFPDALDPAQASVVEMLEKTLESEPRNAALAAVSALDQGALPKATFAWYRSAALERAGRPKEALAALEICVGLAPSWSPGVVRRGRLLFELGRDREARESFASLVELPHLDANSTTEAALALLQLSDPETATRLVDRAFARTSREPILHAVKAMIAKAENGPSFGKLYEVRTTNFHITSDIDQKACEDAGRILEESYLSYTIHLTKVKDASTRRFRVYLFRGEDGYANYLKELLGAAPSHTAGLYSPHLKQLLIWNLPRRDEMLKTVRHEGFHQYLDRVGRGAPVWFNEGMAEYYESAILKGSEWQMGDPRADHLEVLGKQTVPLARFLAMDAADFYRDAQENYAQAWALVHFLRHGPPEHRARFTRLWEALVKGAPESELVDLAFPPGERPAIEAAFTAHVASLRK